MTSSLVGSEMCIRDSTTTATLAECHLGTQKPGAHYMYVGGMHRRNRCTIPVSYTHLTLPTICSV
eukprot:6206400-Prorocentrum_lima.AAC.1